MILTFSNHVPLTLRSPRNIALFVLGAAAMGAVAWYQRTRPRPTAEELERTRREFLANTGCIVDGSITETPLLNDIPEPTPTVLTYRYRIGGVTYECAQDVTPLAEQVRDVRTDLPVQVRYDPRNPGDSIVVAETWNGLRLNGSRMPNLSMGRMANVGEAEHG